MRKLKYFLLVIVVLLLAVGGYAAYELKFKKYDVADDDVDAIVDETFTIEMPDGTVLVMDKDGTVVEEEQFSVSQLNATNANAEGSSDETLTENQNALTAENSETTSSDSNKEKPTVAMIKDKYRSAFKALESQSRSRLNGLMSQAKTEYSTKKANGESVSYGYFYNKYMGAANSVEASTDAALSALVEIVKQDLKKNGFTDTYADSFITEYEATKEALRNEMWGKVKSSL